MAESSWPLPNADPDLDRAVDDVQYERLFAAAGGTGLVGSAADAALVYGDSTGRQVKFLPNRGGLVRGHPWWTDIDGLVKPVAPNAGANRVDLAVLRLDRDDWSVTAQIRQGTPGQPAPAPVQDLDVTGAGAGIYEEPLAEITCRTGFSTIAPADVKFIGRYITPSTLTCTSKGRPPARPGLRIHETDTGRGYVALSTAANSWLLVYEDSGELACTTPNAAVWAFATNSIRRVNGHVDASVSLRRVAASIAPSSTDYVIGNLPAGCFPSKPMEVPAYVINGGATLGSFQPNGTITVRSYPGIPKDSYVIMHGGWRAQP